MPGAADSHGSAHSTEGRASRGLDWFNLFVANIQTGFGTFIAVYLSSQSWTQTSIGLALSIGTVSSMAWPEDLSTASKRVACVESGAASAAVGAGNCFT